MIRAGDRGHREYFANHYAGEIVILDIDGGLQAYGGEQGGQFIGRLVEGDEFLEPGIGDPHNQNCRRKRRSPSKK